MDRWLGKTALVTGAASGIGEAITRALLRNGVNVAAVDIQKEKLARLLTDVSKQRGMGKLYTMYCDLSKGEDIDRVFEHIEQAYNGVDILVNNAGVTIYTRVIGTFVFARNVLEKSTYFLTQKQYAEVDASSGKYYTENNFQRIINFLSVGV